jgi:integrase
VARCNENLGTDNFGTELPTNEIVLMAARLNVKPPKMHRGVDPESRRRSWLDAYENARWTVSDSEGSGKQETINFDVRMADGRSLLEHADLYTTAKELTFWIRAGTYTRLDDALRHKHYGETMVRLCYGLTARGFSSFAALTSIDIDTICEEAAFGVDGLTAASTLLKNALSAYSSWEQVPGSLIKGQAFDLKAVVDAFNLPPTWARKELISEVSSATARLNGIMLASVADVKEEPIRVQNIQAVTMVFEALFTLRHFIEASPIGFRPFPEGAARRAADLGSTSIRTPIPPPELALRMMENSARYIVEHGDNVLAAYRAILDALRDRSWAEAIAIRSQISSLAVACYVLIATFTARRSEEIKLLERDCIAGNDLDGWWVKVYIEKTERQRTWIPIPGIVARAVEVLRSLTPDGAPDGPLFQYLDPVTRKFSELSPDKLLNPFAESIGAREYANDNNEKTETWNWVTRQFRRFFAVLFFYRYRGKLETLAHHLRHFNLQMTNDYVTLDPENAKIWTQEVWNYQVEVVRDLVSGRSVYSGPMGRRLNKLVARLRDKYSSSVLVVSEIMGKALLRQMKKNQMVLTPKPWVTCTCPRSRRGCEKAACRKLAGFDINDLGPDFAAAGPTVCPECPWALIGPENLAHMDEQLEAMSVDTPSEHGGTIFAELLAANVIALGRFRDDLKGA